MLDIREIGRDPEGFRQRLARRGAVPGLDEIIELDARRRALIQQGDALRHAKSEAEKGMRTADKQGAEFAAFRDQMRSVAADIKRVAATT